MLNQRSAARIRTNIVRLSQAGLDSRSFRREAMRQLRFAVPVDSFWFATADPETLLFTGSIVEEIPEATTPLFVTNEFLQDDVNKWVKLAVTRPFVDSLASATNGRLESSPRYRNILIPLGFGDELRAVLHDGHAAWGFMCLHRERTGTNFTRDEALFLASLVPHLAQGLRSAVLLGRATSADDAEPGLLLLTGDFSLMAATSAGEKWLAEIADQPNRQELPQVVYAAAGRLLTETESSDGVELPRARVQTRTGQWLTVHASRVSGANGIAQIAVILEPAQPLEVVPLLLDAYGLTNREADVARLVLRGVATAGIATELSISESTVQQHLKSIFDKAGVGSRRELVAYIFARHYWGRAVRKGANARGDHLKRRQS
jgi:DNA-binding CsgD family transcriptional regulator